MLGWVYTIHFSRPFGHANHYTGFAKTKRTLAARLEHHRRGTGSRLCRHAREAGIEFIVVSVERGSRERERQLKNQGGASRRCKICRKQRRARA